jgi:Phage integrase family
VTSWAGRPYLTGTEPVALKLAEAVLTNLSGERVDDEPCARPSAHYDHKALWTLTLAIGQICVSIPVALTGKPLPGHAQTWSICAQSSSLGPPPERALISLLALNGLRVSEATGADIEHLGLERGHRTLTITRKGGKVVTIPLAPRTARAIDLAIGERTEGPVFLAGDGRRLDRHGAGRIVRKVARRAGIGKAVTPHTLRHAFITAALDAGVPLRDVQDAASHADPRTTMRSDRARGSLDRHATYIVAAYVAGAAR